MKKTSITVADPLSLGQQEAIDICYVSPYFFINTYCQIYDSVSGQWIPFKLWSAQQITLDVVHGSNKAIVLKARQLGLTWLSIAYALWAMLFNPIQTVLFFSKRETEAIYGIGEDRMKGIYQRLPDFMKPPLKKDSAREWSLSNGSAVRAFTTRAGDSYAGTLAIVDEADLVTDLDRLMRSVQPAVGDAGKILLISRVDKNSPNSGFKNIFRGSVQRKNDWASVFLPWYVRSDRDVHWYETQKRDAFARTGSYDSVFEQYPSTVDEALAPPTVDRRFSYIIVSNVFDQRPPIDPLHSHAGVEEAMIYDDPLPNVRYVIGVDPAEGNPTSDDSAVVVMNKATGDEVALLIGKHEPSALARFIERLSLAYNFASVLVERNNHGHTVINWLSENTRVKLLNGLDKRKGWHTNLKSKSVMYNQLSDAFYDETVEIRSELVYYQLISIEGTTLNAPTGMNDDASIAFALANYARSIDIKRKSRIRSYSFTQK